MTRQRRARRQIGYLKNFSTPPGSIAGEHCQQLIRARCTLLIYTAFTNLICNKEITYGRAK
jgi:hypothetical protein